VVVAAVAAVEEVEEEHVAAEAAGERAAVAVRAQVAGHQGVAVGDRTMWLRAVRQCHGRALQTSNDRVEARAKLQIVGHQWVTCRRRAKGRLQGRAIVLVQETSPAARARELGPAEATLPIGRTSVISPAPALAQALVRELSPAQDQQPAHGRRRAMCKTSLICRTLAAVTSAAIDHSAALVMPLRSPAAGWQVEQLQNSCKIVRAMRFRARAASLEIESMLACRGNPEIASMPVFPVSQGIEWMQGYRGSPEIVWMPACQGNLEIASMLVFLVSRGIAWTRAYRVNPEIESMPACPGSLETAWTVVGRASQT
jgi:hypothetical protein